MTWMSLKRGADNSKHMISERKILEANNSTILKENFDLADLQWILWR